MFPGLPGTPGTPGTPGSPGSPNGPNDRRDRYSARFTSGQARAWAAGLDVAYGLIGAGLIGAAIDYYAGTFPMWMLILGAFGLVWGFYRFVKDALALNAESAKKLRGLPPLALEEEPNDGPLGPDDGPHDGPNGPSENRGPDQGPAR